MFAVVVVTLILFVGAGFAKVLGIPPSIQMRDDLGVSPTLWRVIGALELLGVAGVIASLLHFVPLWLGEAAAFGFIVLILGAIVTRVRAKSPVLLLLLDIVTLLLSVLTLYVIHGR